MKITDNSLIILKKRYYKKDVDGNTIEDWNGMISRVANNIAGDDDSKKERYFKLLDSGKFLPNSPTLMNAGNDIQQLSACFVLPIEDSMESIFNTLKNAALIHKSGGGTGFSFSRLREKNSRVRSTNGVSSGIIPFMEVYNSATNAVKQGGTRRGANMAILKVTHPQIMEFITAKEDITKLTNFNISVGVNNEFMEAVKQDGDFNLISPFTNKVTKTLKARVIFDKMVELAHKNGEPGIIFLDKINEFNPTPHIGEIESTNPCGEQPLLPNEACNLGSINLAAFVKDGEIDWEDLKFVIKESVEFLDDVIDRTIFPLKEIDEMVKGNRKIGLGVMGWSDLLFMLKIPYNSEKGLELAKKVMEFIDYYGKEKSVELAELHGSFPNYKGSIYDTGNLKREGNLDWNGLIKKMSTIGIRNATITTIAPTGTISMIADTSSGVEPQFSLVFVKNVMDGEKLLYVNKHFENALKEAGLYSKDLLEKVAQHGSIKHLDEIPESIKKIFVTSHDISPEWHVKMQSSFQEYVDNAVSKTINFLNDASPEDIKTAYQLAYDTKCKGITVYRDGSRTGQVLNIGDSIKKDAPKIKIQPRKRPEVTTGTTQKIETGCGHMYVTINSDEKGACEVFIQMGKVGGCASAQLQSIARLISLSLRSNVSVESIIRQMKGIRCPSPTWSKGKAVTSCSDAVAQALENYLSFKDTINIKNVEFTEVKPTQTKKMVGTCPECGSAIENTEGCLKCPSCGWSKC